MIQIWGEQSRDKYMLSWKKIISHFKGDLYIIKDIAEHIETVEDMVVYRAWYVDCNLYVRPVNMVLEKYTMENTTKYKQENRFERVFFESAKK